MSKYLINTINPEKINDLIKEYNAGNTNCIAFFQDLNKEEKQYLKSKNNELSSNIQTRTV